MQVTLFDGADASRLLHQAKLLPVGNVRRKALVHPTLERTTPIVDFGTKSTWLVVQFRLLYAKGKIVDYFEGIIKTLLEHEGHWVRQSFKVNLTKEEKRNIGKPSIPRPEIDLLAFNAKSNSIIALEAKSYLDSPGVKIDDLSKNHDIPEGRYKLFTCVNYRNIVFSRLKKDLISLQMANEGTSILLGLAAGNVYQSRSEDIRAFFNNRGWLFWSPEDIKQKVYDLASKGYENEPAIITAKILMR